MENKGCNCGKCKEKLCTYKVPIFSSLDYEEMISLTNLIIHKKYEKGENIILEGCNLDRLMIINKGKVKAYRYNKDGKEQILYIFSEGDFFGENNLFINKKANYNVEALEDTLICTISKKDFQNLMLNFGSISVKIMESLTERLQRLENGIESMGIKSVETRVNIVLLEFMSKYGIEKKEGILVNLPLSREGIANYIGVTRETVSRKLSYLYNEGIIEIIGNKQILVKDKKALEETIK